MPERFSRRPFKKKKPTQNHKGLFVVEGLSAVSEYVRFKPSSLQFIVYKSISFCRELKSLGQEMGEDKFIAAKSYDEGPTGLNSKAPVWACVRIESKSEEEFFSSIGEGSSKTILLLDHITDPRNLGAILRSAAFYGIKQVVVPKDRQVLLTGASVNTAQGAFALVDLFVVTNLSRIVEELKKRNYWIMGTSLMGEPMEELKALNSKDNLALVLGSEEKGLSRGVEKSCDWLVLLEGGAVSLNSLNVSVAAGIFCDRIHQLRKKASKKA